MRGCSRPELSADGRGGDRGSGRSVQDARAPPSTPHTSSSSCLNASCACCAAHSLTMASTPVLVVALDFGTTYSGYAYSFRSDFERNPLHVSSQNFISDSMQSAKVPTSVLFKPDETFDCFGFDAEKKYAQMCDEDSTEARRWYFFERFKMTLHRNRTLSRDTVLPDQTKKKGLPAFQVFSAAIAHLKDHLMQTLRWKDIYVRDEEISWMLTVPAIWDDNAKNFMREAAEKAGLPRDRLRLALEPEAASVYCLQSSQAQQTLSTPLSRLQPGTKFMMVDCGGGTIDISVFEVKGDSTLRHLHRPEGSPDGGTKVDDAFKAFLYELIGVDGISSFDRMEMLALRQEFEKTKRTNPKSERVAIVVPGTVEMALNEGSSQSTNYAKKVKVTRKRLMMDLDIYRSFFNASATSITQHIRDVLDDQRVGSVDAILLAGGFSESDVIQEAVRTAFPREQVLVAPSPSAAVLIGAVLFGHNSDVITTRISAYTYGVACSRPFDEKVHDPEKKYSNDHGTYCNDCFNIYIQRDEEVEVNTLLPYKSYAASHADATEAIFPIYRSTKESPVYVDEEGCEKIGSVTLPMLDTKGGKDREIKATMMVGGTELKLLARDETTQKEVSVMCDFLSKTD